MPFRCRSSFPQTVSVNPRRISGQSLLMPNLPSVNAHQSVSLSMAWETSLSLPNDGQLIDLVTNVSSQGLRWCWWLFWGESWLGPAGGSVFEKKLWDTALVVSQIASKISSADRRELSYVVCCKPCDTIARGLNFGGVFWPAMEGSMPFIRICYLPFHHDHRTARSFHRRHNIAMKDTHIRLVRFCRFNDQYDTQRILRVRDYVTNLLKFSD